MRIKYYKLYAQNHAQNCPNRFQPQNRSQDLRNQTEATQVFTTCKTVDLAMARATAAETSDRIDTLQGLILEGEPNTVCLTFARQQWGVSRAQGYRLLKRAWTQIKADVDETGIDRQELLAWSIQTLMAAAGQAKQQKNPGAVVACIKQLDWMTGLGINSISGSSAQRRR